MSGKEKLISDGRFIHEGRRLKAGDEFEAESGEAADLVALKMAYRKPRSQQNSIRTTSQRNYSRRDMQAEDPGEPAKAEE